MKKNTQPDSGGEKNVNEAAKKRRGRPRATNLLVSKGTGKKKKKTQSLLARAGQRKLGIMEEVGGGNYLCVTNKKRKPGMPKNSYEKKKRKLFISMRKRKDGSPSG